jgi:hypothetical protein
VNGPVGWAGLAVSLLLVAVAAAISWWQRLGLHRQILIAATRALAQLLLVGAALTLIISPGRSIWWSWLWVAAMLGYASVVARRRAPEVPHLLPLALASLTAAAVVTLGLLFGLHVFPLTGRTLVPIAGMMIGNSMTASGWQPGPDARLTKGLGLLSGCPPVGLLLIGRKEPSCAERSAASAAIGRLAGWLRRLGWRWQVLPVLPGRTLARI